MIDRRRGERRVGERRDDDRAPSQARFRFLRAGEPPHEVLDGRLLDFSRGGLKLLLTRPLAPGDRVLIEVRDLAGHCSSLAAETIWCEPAFQGGHVVGCELRVDLSRRQRLVLTSECASR